MNTLAFLFSVAIFVALLSWASHGRAYAADPVSVQVTGVEEQAGRMTVILVVTDQAGRPIPALGTANFNAWANEIPLILRDVNWEAASPVEYVLELEVPRSVDRTVAGTLRVHVARRADHAYAEAALRPLPGAVRPPFRVTLDGLAAGSRLSGVATLLPAVQEGIEIVRFEYFLDGVVIHTVHTTQLEWAGFELDAVALEPGRRVLKVVATDAAGREGEVQVPFIVVVPAQPAGVNWPVVAGAALIPLVLVLVVVWKLLSRSARRRREEEPIPLASAAARPPLSRPPVGRRPQSSGERPRQPAEAPRQRLDRVLGRLVVMDEAAVRAGDLQDIREYPLRASPITFGSGPTADVRVGSAGGAIAAEEARVWVQRGRLVYHKLTTLSAMAMEGVTAGWQFLEDGEEMRVGPYRLTFQAWREEMKAAEAPPPPEPERRPQEHGMRWSHDVPAAYAASPPAPGPQASRDAPGASWLQASPASPGEPGPPPPVPPNGHGKYPDSWKSFVSAADEEGGPDGGWDADNQDDEPQRLWGT